MAHCTFTTGCRRPRATRSGRGPRSRDDLRGGGGRRGRERESDRLTRSGHGSPATALDSGEGKAGALCGPRPESKWSRVGGIFDRPAAGGADVLEQLQLPRLPPLAPAADDPPVPPDGRPRCRWCRRGLPCGVEVPLPLGPPHRRRVERWQQGGPRGTSSVGSRSSGSTNPGWPSRSTSIASTSTSARRTAVSVEPSHHWRSATVPGPKARSHDRTSAATPPQGTPRRWVRRARPPWTPTGAARRTSRPRSWPGRSDLRRTGWSAPGARPTPVRPTIAPPRRSSRPRATRSPCGARTSWLPDHRPMRRGPRRRRQTTSGRRRGGGPPLRPP